MTTTTMGCAHPRPRPRPRAGPVRRDHTRRDPAGASRQPRAPPAHDTSFAGTVRRRRTTALRRPLSAADASRRPRRTLAGHHRSRARPRMLLLLRARRGVRRARDRCERLPCREPLVCFPSVVIPVTGIPRHYWGGCRLCTECALQQLTGQGAADNLLYSPRVLVLVFWPKAVACIKYPCYGLAEGRSCGWCLTFWLS
jgi:hypothetical protein